MGVNYTALHRDLRTHGRKQVRVGRHGIHWRVVFFTNGRFHQQMRFLCEAQARGEAARVVMRHGYVCGSDLSPVADDGLWHDASAEGNVDE